MLNNLLLILLIIILIYTISNKSEQMTNNKKKKIEYLNPRSSYFLKDLIYQSNKTIEITTLPLMIKKDLKFDYGTNANNLINNKISIKQEIIDPLLINIEINNVNYNLTTISFKKSKFTFGGKLVGLELHLLHKKSYSINFITIIIPLNLVSIDFLSYDDKSKTFENFGNSNDNIESFRNLNYKKMINNLPIYTDTNFNENENYNNINVPSYFLDNTNFQNQINSLKGKFNLNINIKVKSSKYSLDKLISSELLIPKYECCKDTIGQIMKLDLFDLQNLLIENEYYYEINDLNNNKYYITKPMNFPENIGLNIRESITYDDLIFKKK